MDCDVCKDKIDETKSREWQLCHGCNGHVHTKCLNIMCHVCGALYCDDCIKNKKIEVCTDCGNRFDDYK